MYHFPSTANPLPQFCPDFFDPFLLRSSTADSSPVTSLCELNPNSLCNRLRNRNQKTWCWVNINKTRAAKPYQLIGVKNSDSGEVSRCEFLFNFFQKHCKLLRKALSRCGRSQWSEEKQEWDIWKASCYIAGCAVRRNQNAMKWLQLLTIKCEMVLSVSLVVLKSAATKYKQIVINQPPESAYLLFVGI